MAQGTPSAVDKAEADSDKALEEFVKAGQQEPSDALDTLASEPEDKPEEPKAPAEAPKPVETSSEIEALKKQLEFEKHRNDSLQGRIESQLRPANDSIRQLREELAFLKGRQDSVERRESDAPKGPAHTRHLKPEEIEAVGKDAIDLQARVARGVTEEELAKLKAEAEAKQAAMEARIRAMESDREQATVGQLWDRVEKLSPGAKQANASDPGWFEFLNQADPDSGISRRQIGETAASVGDVRRLAMLHGEYLKASGKAPAEAPATPVDVKPETVKAAPASQSPSASRVKVVLRESDIKRFYNDYQRGKYRGREEEAKKMEAKIEQAVQEGRVTSG